MQSLIYKFLLIAYIMKSQHDTEKISIHLGFLSLKCGVCALNELIQNYHSA